VQRSTSVKKCEYDALLNHPSSQTEYKIGKCFLLLIFFVNATDKIQLFFSDLFLSVSTNASHSIK